MDTKKGWNTRILLGFLVKAIPDVGLREKPVTTHEVIVSGIFLVRVNSSSPTLYKDENNSISF